MIDRCHEGGIGLSVTHKPEKEKLEEENKLLRAKTEMLQATKNTEELYGEAIKMMRVYQGIDDGEDEQDGY